MNSKNPTLNAIAIVMTLLSQSILASAHNKEKKAIETQAHNFSIHASAGSLNVAGDVRSKSFWDQSVYKPNTIGYELGMQFRLDKKHIYAEVGISKGTAHGFNYTPSTGYQFGNADNPWIRSGYTGPVYYNYCTQIRMLKIAGIYSTDRRKRISGQAGLGLSALMYSSWTDARNSRGNLYDISFDKINTSFGNNPDNKKEINENLQNLFDDDFESPSEGDGEEPGTYTLVPSISFKLGLEIKIVPDISFGIKNQLFFTSSDLIDGQQWQERSGVTRDKDLVNYLAVELRYHLY